MRSDDELDKETDRFVARLWILGIIIVVLVAAGIFAAIKYSINQDRIQEKLASDTYKEEHISNKLKVKAELRRHNFPIEHPKHHVETKDGVEYWYCDEEYCWYFMAIDIETGDIVAEGNAHWPCDTDVSVVSAMLNKQTEDALNEISKGGK
jgi:hypothetical protein